MEKWLQDIAYRIEMNYCLFLLGGFIALLIALTTTEVTERTECFMKPTNN